MNAELQDVELKVLIPVALFLTFVMMVEHLSSLESRYDQSPRRTPHTTQIPNLKIREYSTVAIEVKMVKDFQLCMALK